MDGMKEYADFSAIELPPELAESAFQYAEAIIRAILARWPE